MEISRKPKYFAKINKSAVPRYDFAFKDSLYKQNSLRFRDGGHEQLISNGGRFKPVFSERDQKQTMIDLRGISTNWFKNQLCHSIRISRLRAQNGNFVMLKTSELGIVLKLSKFFRDD